MICDRVLGNIHATGQRHGSAPSAETVELEWFECFRRAIRKQMPGNKVLRLLPPLGTTLLHGDVLGNDHDQAIAVVCVTPCPLLAALPGNALQMGQIATELGNLHVPVEVRADGSLLILPDGPAEAVLRRWSVRYDRVTARFSPLRASVPEEFRLADGFTLTRRGAST